MTQVRVFRGVYVDKDAPPLQRIRAAVLSAGAPVVVSHETAAWLHGYVGMTGLQGVWSPRPGVHVTAARDRRLNPQKGRTVHRHDLSDSEVVELHGMPVTSLIRTAQDLLCSLPTKPVVVALDAALNSGLLTASDLVQIPAGLTSRHGSVRARRTLARVRPEAESPLESLSRLEFEDRGLAPQVLQHRVPGYRADFGWGIDGKILLLGEADGDEFHLGNRSRADDRRREDALRRQGYEVVRWDWKEMVHDPESVLRRVREQLNLAIQRFAVRNGL